MRSAASASVAAGAGASVTMPRQYQSTG
jgi:hypothetical protein